MIETYGPQPERPREKTPRSTPNETPVQRRPKTPAPLRKPASLDRLFLYQRGELSWDQMTGFRSGPKRRDRELALWSWLAVLIDALVVISMSATFVLAFKFITRITSREIFTSLSHLHVVPLLLGALVVGAWLYMIVTRVFFGFSIGEWACDLRLGQPTERMKLSYPFKVLLRASLIFATGLIVLPLLSVLFGGDCAGRLSGVRLVSLR